MHEITQDMQKAGLVAFMTWREAPHGIGFGDVVTAIYTAMEKARADNAVYEIRETRASMAFDEAAAEISAKAPAHKTTPKARTKAPAKKV